MLFALCSVAAAGQSAGQSGDCATLFGPKIYRVGTKHQGWQVDHLSFSGTKGGCLLQARNGLDTAEPPPTDDGDDGSGHDGGWLDHLLRGWGRGNRPPGDSAATSGATSAIGTDGTEGEFGTCGPVFRASVELNQESVFGRWEIPPRGTKVEKPVQLEADNELKVKVQGRLGSCVQIEILCPAQGQAPVADAGRDQEIVPWQKVILDGSGSSDADGNRLSYLWSLVTRPSGSTAALSDPAAIQPDFIADAEGKYVAQLVVNDGQHDSAADQVVLSTQNIAPVADAGADQVAAAGQTVTLDGSGSSDADGDPLSFVWSLVQVPAGSATSLSDPSAVRPHLSLDQPGDYLAQLQVSDGALSSSPDQVLITTGNAPPVADAGPDRSTSVATPVVLDGSGSHDPNGDSLSYSWSLIARPADSLASLSNPSSVSPQLTLDVPGTYVAQLIVSDGVAQSAPDEVLIGTGNTRPVADAGPDLSAVTGQQVQLDGSASRDADADPLSFDWSLLVRPPGSSATLVSPTLDKPQLTPDKGGTYLAQLLVSDGSLTSVPDTAVVVANSRPIAQISANPTQPSLGQTVQLDGSASADADGQTLTYAWQLTPPAGSSAVLGNATSPTPAFTADVSGTYQVSLVVSDGELDSTPATLDISVAAQNLPPQLLPPGDRDVPADRSFQMTLFAVDPEHDPLTFSLVSGPPGMTVAPGGVLSWAPGTGDEGDHPVQVRVSDGRLSDQGGFNVHVSPPLSGLSGPPNAPPVLQPIPDQSLSLGQGLDLSAPVVSASDPEGGPLVFSLFGPAGMTIDPASGHILWTPTADQIGPQDVTVRVTDEAGLADARQFVVTVRVVNRAPSAEDDSYTARIGETLTVAAPGVMQNDSDPDGDPLTALKVSDPAHGALSFNPDGSFDYTPTVPSYTGLYTRVPATDADLSLAMPAPALEASSVSPLQAYQLESSIDDDLNTSWVTVSASGEVSYQQTFSDDIRVKEVDIYSTRVSPDGHDFISGQVQLLDADGNELFNTGVLSFPDVSLAPPDRDVVLDISTLAGGPVAGVRTVRFSSSQFEGTSPALGELHVIGDGTVNQSNIATERVVYGTENSAIRECTSNNLVVGDINGDGAADVVCPTNTAGIGNVAWTAFSGADGSVLWNISGFPFPTGRTDIPDLYLLGDQATLADIDNDGRPELLLAANTDNGTLHDRLAAFAPDGSLKWISDPIGNPYGAGIRGTAPAVADLDGDGQVEIVSGQASNRITIFDHDGKALVSTIGAGNTGSYTNGPDEVPIIADIDLDGHPEIIYGDDVYDYTGAVKWSGDPSTGVGTVREAAVANLDDDPEAEVVQIDGNGNIAAYDHDGTLKWRNSYYQTDAGINGPMSIADIDGDGYPEIMGTFGSYLRVLDHNGQLKWQRLATTATGASFRGPPTPFDFDGDGVMELLHQRPGALSIFDGRDGTLLMEIPTDAGNQSQQAQPLVVDADGDGQAEILLLGSRLGVTGGGDIYMLGAATGSWPATRPFWSYAGYHITDVASDGKVPSPEPINWLTPGLNDFRINVPLPEERKGRSDSFTYKVNDGALDSNVARVYLDVLAAGGPPHILSRPDTTATVGFRYEYRVLASDPDVGDVLGYALSSAPPGMSIDPVSGRISWTPGPGDAGEHAIGVTVSDTQGFSDFQAYTLTVGLPVTVPNLLGSTQGDAENALAAAQLQPGQVTQVHDAQAPAGTVTAQSPPAGSVAEYGASVDLSVSLGPGPGDSDSDGDGFTPNQGDCNDSAGDVYPGAPDSQGDGIDQNCDGVDGVLVLSAIQVQPSSQTVLTGQQVHYSATGILADGTSIPLSGLAGWSSSDAAVSVDTAGVATALSPGTASIQASYEGVSGSTNLTVIARASGDTLAPVAQIAAPAAGSSITAPTEITGTATDADFLKYELAIAPAGEAGFTVIRTGTSPVADGVLGTLDPTQLINDQYTLRLRVYDTGGNVTTDERVYQVEGGMKIGNFTLSFTDLNIPMAGIPITITRTYDSRDKGRGDFGVGWRLGIQALRLRSNRPLATGWQLVQSSFFHQLVADDAHKVSITLPDGRVEEFDLVLSRTSAIGPGFDAFASFVPRPGTVGKLELDEDNLVNIVGVGISGEDIEILNNDLTGPFAPRRFIYTTLEGTRIVIVRDSGVESVTDRSGNSLTFGSDGITHSSGKAVTFARDAEGRITSITDPDGNLTRYDYDASGNLARVTDPPGQVTRFVYGPRHDLLNMIDADGANYIRSEYDSAGRLVAIVDALGRRTEFSHDLDNRREVITDRRGFTTVREYDERGNVISTTDAAGGTTVATFDANDNMLSRTDPLGNKTTFTYNDDNLPLTETDALGNTESHTYDGFGRELTTTDRDGNVTTRTYDSRGNLVATTDPLGHTTTATFDSHGSPLTETDALGNTTAFTYDGAGNLLTVTDPLGHGVSHTYDDNGNRLSTTRTRTTAGVPSAETTSYAYDSLGRLVEVTSPGGGVESYEYDAIGNRTAAVDPNGNRTTFSYDDLHQLVATGYADSTTESYAYDADGNRVSTTDRAGRTTTRTLDALGRVVMTTYPDGAIEQKSYDAAGRLVSETDAVGNTTTHNYDAAGRRLASTDALGKVRSFTYDGQGNPLTDTDENGNTTRFEYDAVDRLLRTVRPDGSATSTSYDALGRATSETDPDGNTTTYSDDAVGNLSAVTDALGQTTSYLYDEVGNRVARADAAGNVTRYEYDALRHTTRTILPLGMSERRDYDANGNLVGVVDFNGDRVDYSYDSNDRLIARDYPDNSSTTFTYTPTGRRASATDRRGTTVYEYDDRDRLTRRTDPDGRAVAYEYDDAGNRTTMTTATGVTTYTYDALNRIATVSDPAGGTMTYVYDAAGNPTGLTYPDGTTTSRTYDTLDRLTAVETRRADNGLVSRYDYTLDDAGDRTRVVEASGRSVDYSYDALQRLLSEDISDPVNGDRSISYTYSPTGNRLSKTDGAGVTNYTYDADDQLLTQTGPATSATYAYDNNGNRVARAGSAGTTLYGFDFDGRLSAVLQTDTSVEYSYDADGLRVARDENGATTGFLWDANRRDAQVIEEHDGNSDPSASYVWGAGYSPLAGDTPAGLRYYLADASHNVRRLIDPSSTQTDSRDLDAFGNTLQASGDTPNPWRLHGQYQDDASGLYYLRARWYDPGTGAFVSRDPARSFASDPPSSNAFMFARQNPVSLADPSGLSPDVGSLSAALGIQGTIDNVRPGPAPGVASVKRNTLITLHPSVFQFGIRHLNSTLYEWIFVVGQFRLHWNPKAIHLERGAMVTVAQGWGVSDLTWDWQDTETSHQSFKGLKNIAVRHSLTITNIAGVRGAVLRVGNADREAIFWLNGRIIPPSSPRGVVRQ